jgi:predicted amidohydrolase
MKLAGQTTRIAVAQLQPRFADSKGNVALTVEAIHEAAGKGANILVMPELVSCGYMFASRAEAFGLAEVAGKGPATTTWLQAAAETGLIVVAGFAELAGDVLYNSAFMALPDGRWSLYRKVHLWDEEALYFEPGDLGFTIADSIYGRVGVMICYDNWFPEAYRALADAGADLVCVPTNWVPLAGHQAGTPAMATLLVRTAAHVNGLVVAAADRVGTERGQDFIGQSLIVSAAGIPLAGPASDRDPALLYADVDLSDARRSRAWGRFNNPLRDRRPASYVTSNSMRSG